MDIAIASGKGGTGKTTVSLCMAEYFAERGILTALLDCDVEEPNANLFLKSPVDTVVETTVLIPSVNDRLCTGCGACEKICEFNSIVLIKGRPLVLPDMCHSCGGCSLICPENAIAEIKRVTGIIETGEIHGIKYAGGRLNIGEAMSPPLIKEVKKYYPESEVRIVDSPPGTTCPVIESVKGSDFIILVGEPTPFGLNDLKLAVEMARAVEIPFGVVENKSNDNNNSLREFCKREKVDMLASIPETREIAERYSIGDPVSYITEFYSGELDRIAGFIREKNLRSIRI